MSAKNGASEFTGHFGWADREADTVAEFSRNNRAFLNLEQQALLADTAGLLDAISQRFITAGQPRIVSNLISVLRTWDQYPPSLPAEEMQTKIDYLITLLGAISCLGFTAEHNEIGVSRSAKQNQR